MSLPVWPATVEHRPLRAAFRLIEPDMPPLETEFEGGDVRSRPRSTVTRRLFAFGWDWGNAEFQSFETWYRATLGKGALRFTMPVFEDVAYVGRTCQFKGRYEANRPGNFWRVTAQLYVWGGP